MYKITIEKDDKKTEIECDAFCLAHCHKDKELYSALFWAVQNTDQIAALAYAIIKEKPGFLSYLLKTFEFLSKEDKKAAKQESRIIGVNRDISTDVSGTA